MQLHQRDTSRGFDAEAFAVAERSRALSLLDTLIERQVKVTPLTTHSSTRSTRFAS